LTILKVINTPYTISSKLKGKSARKNENSSKKSKFITILMYSAIYSGFSNNNTPRCGGEAISRAAILEY
jgi:hypothetical protein